MYTLFYHPRALKFLSKIPKKDAQKLHQKIGRLAKNPFDQTIDVKKLATTSHSYRLRVGTIRVIFEIDTSPQRIYIHDIDFRGNIY